MMKERIFLDTNILIDICLRGSGHAARSGKSLLVFQSGL